MKPFISLLLLASMLISMNSFAAPSAEVSSAPDISLPGISGDVQLKDYKGKVVYLDFWASWCIPCKKSFPWLQEMKQRYADQGFAVLAVNLDKERELADEFLKEMKVDFTIAFDESGDVASQYKVKGMPSSYLIGRDGKIYASHVGFREKDKPKLEQAIKTLLGQTDNKPAK